MATFANSKTVSQLSTQGIYLNVIENPKTKKLFIADEAGNPMGAVSTKCGAIIRKNKSIDNSWVVSDFTSDEGETFKMLHSQGENNGLIASTRPLAKVASF
jgi:hypothetical protein